MLQLLFLKLIFNQQIYLNEKINNKQFSFILGNNKEKH